MKILQRASGILPEETNSRQWLYCLPARCRKHVAALAFALALALWFAPSAARAQPVILTTAYTRGLLIQATAAACRAYLGITNTASFINFNTNSFVVVGTNVSLASPLILTNVLLVGSLQGLNYDTTVFNLYGGSNITLQGSASSLPLTNVAFAGATTIRRVSLGSPSSTLTVDPSLADEFSVTLTNDLTLGFTLASWSDGHNVRLRAANTGNYTLTITNVAYWYPTGTSTQATNDWGSGKNTGFSFWKDAGVIYASDKEGIAGGGGTTINPTNNYVPYRFDATTFKDSQLKIENANLITVSEMYGWLSSPANYSVGIGYINGAAGGSYNVAIGYLAMQNAAGGNASYNVAIGKDAGNQITDDQNNVYVGSVAGSNLKGSQNIVIGGDNGNVNWHYSGNSINIGYGKWGTVGILTNLVNSVDIGGYSTYLGVLPTNTLPGVTNSIVIGHNGITHGNNTATIGDANVTSLYLGNTLIAGAASTTAPIQLRVETAALPASNPATPSKASDYVWEMLFDDTTSQSAAYTFMMPQDYASGLTVRFKCTVKSVQTGTKALGFRFYVAKLGAAGDPTAPSFGTVNTATVALANNQAANSTVESTVALANAQSIAAGNLCVLKVDRDPAVANDATGNGALVGALNVEYSR